MLEVLQTIGVWLAWFFVVALCVSGVIVSCISLSGTWFVTLATVLAAALRDDAFPGYWTIGIFIAISIVVELAEAGAAAWGVARRGGSSAAGWAAMGGGLLGLILGGLIPIPLVGSLIGMIAGSFGAAYLVELRRLKSEQKATHIATGAVMARVLTILLKVATTLGMAAFLGIGILLGR